MSLVTDNTKKLYRHINELENMNQITESEASRLRDRLNALEGDLQEAYDRDEDHPKTDI